MDNDTWIINGDSVLIIPIDGYYPSAVNPRIPTKQAVGGKVPSLLEVYFSGFTTLIVYNG